MSKIIGQYPFELELICKCGKALEISDDERGDYYFSFPCKHSKPIALFISRLSGSIFSMPTVKRFGDKKCNISLVLTPPEVVVSPKKSKPSEVPPCIEKLWESLCFKGKLSHPSRVALTLFYIHSGASDKNIVDFFRGTAGFSEAITRKQVQFLRAKQYGMPSCATLRSYGFCTSCMRSTPLKAVKNKE